MEKNPQQPQHQPLVDPSAESQGGISSAAPAFQLKAAGAAPVVQRVTPQAGAIRFLRDIISTLGLTNAADVRAGRVEDRMLAQTEEFQSLMNPSLVWQTEFQLTYEQARETCLAIMERLVGGGHVDWQAEARRFVRDSLRVRSAEEGLVGSRSSRIGALQPFVNTFTAALTGASTVADIEAVITNRAPQLWTTGRAQTQSTATATARSDESMYWARNALRDVLRQHPVLRLDANIRHMNRLITMLEELSRGSQDLGAFISAPDKLDRILITGFDPFGGGTSNPSGIVAQRLDGQRIAYGGVDEAICEAITFPVRYDDFDHGMVERLVGPIINDPKYKVKMVITISLDNSSETVNFDRFAAHTRAGWSENANFDMSITYPDAMTPSGRHDPFVVAPGLTAAQYNAIAHETRQFILQRYARAGNVPAIPPITSRADLIAWLEGPIAQHYTTIYRNHFQPRGDNGAEFIQSNMNLDAMTGDSTFRGPLRVNQGFTEMDTNGHPKSQTGTTLAANQSEFRGAAVPNTSNAAREGSGGDYLSNEIYHRVSALRTAGGNVIRNVHIHVPNVGNKVAGESINYTAERIVQEVRNAIGLAAHHN